MMPSERKEGRKDNVTHVLTFEYYKVNEGVEIAYIVCGGRRENLGKGSARAGEVTREKRDESDRVWEIGEWSV